MDMHLLPIAERIESLFEVARGYSLAFAGPEDHLARTRYLAEHPTAILVFKCMDGRINIPLATHTPKGVIQPFRNLGGMFNLGWPHLGEVVAHTIHEVVERGRRVLALITYHHSKGERHRGCAGFDYDTAAAYAHTQEIRRQMEHVFGREHHTVYPLVCGFETDEDSLVLHATDGRTLDMASLTAAERLTLRPRLAELFPDMHAQLREDLLPLLLGNLDHIAAVRGTSRALDIEHREWMLCVGRGFDFLHLPNLALIIGPYSPDLADPIRKAAGIIRANMTAGRIPADGFLLLASSPYHEIGVDRARAELKARFLTDFTVAVIRAAEPELAERMHVRTAVLDWRSRALVRIDAGA